MIKLVMVFPSTVRQGAVGELREHLLEHVSLRSGKLLKRHCDTAVSSSPSSAVVVLVFVVVVVFVVVLFTSVGAS